jgi:hypothetical protein
MKQYLILIFAIMLIGIASAEVQSLPTVKQDACAVLKQTCASCTDVNITQVALPNGTTNTLGSYMNNKKPNFDYNFCSTALLGTYIVSTCGDINGDADFTCLGCCVDYDFTVTPDGTESTSWRVTLNIFVAVSALILMILFLYLAGIGLGEKSEGGALRLFFIGLSLVFLISHIIITNSIIHNMFGIGDLTKSYTAIMYIFFSVIILMFLYTMFKVMVWEVDVFRKSKGLR